MPSKGNTNAKVRIVEFLDPGCETCARFHPLIEHLMNEYPGKLKVFIRYLPVHKGSDHMVKILEASRKQGKFWETLEMMFASQPEWASHTNPQPFKIWNYLGNVDGLDLEKLRRDINAPGIDQIIQRDFKDAAGLKVTKTPTFFVNGRPLPRFGYEPLHDLIAEELSNTH
ncbi:MAG: thioredoxin domain-containing protein [SAR324 cluster bacterium]|nr:thioredoxin domain-containing protein [SAR324 cluster bacterium]